jgi:hypothetical protein
LTTSIILYSAILFCLNKQDAIILVNLTSIAMKKVTILGLATATATVTAIGVGVVICAGSVNSSPKRTDWSKLDTNIETLLGKAPTPRPAGNTMTDSYGEKSDCHQLTVQENEEGRTVKQWACWSRKVFK